LGICDTLADKPEGTTVKLNHNECGDTRKRLYVTKKPLGVLLGYCHNCEAWSKYSIETSVHTLRNRGGDTASLEAPVFVDVGKRKLIADEAGLLALPAQLLQWLQSRNLLTLDKRELLYRLTTHATTKGMVFGVPLSRYKKAKPYAETAKVILHDRVVDRFCITDVDSIAVGKRGHWAQCYAPLGAAKKIVLVLTEDSLSAEVVQLAASLQNDVNVQSIALLGTHISKGLLEDVVAAGTRYSSHAPFKIILAFDGDTAGIKASMNLMKVLQAAFLEWVEIESIVKRGDMDIKSWELKKIVAALTA